VHYFTFISESLVTCIEGGSVRVMVFNVTFSYIVIVSLIGGGNRCTRRKPPTCCKSLTNQLY